MEQVDLFGQTISGQPLRRLASLPAATAGGWGRQGSPIDPEAAARILDEHADFRVQRRLRPRQPVGRRALSPGERLVVVLDTETTGLDHARDEVVELGMVAVVHDASGAVVEVADVFDALREPSVPIPPEVSRLTGITWDMVEGKSIDAEDVARFVSDASLVICHNASFDRPFCERLNGVFRDLDWACSIKEVDWSGLGYEGTKLPYLVGRRGWFYDAHRAIDDCHALIELLAAPVPDRGATILSLLTAAAAKPCFRIWAERAPYEAKDRLKARRYRWSDGADGRARAWWIEVGESAVEEEIEYLRREVYGWDATPRVQRLNALDRYRAA